MKIKYFIIAGSQSYEFLHGMYNTAIVELDATLDMDKVEDELSEIGYELSEEIITDYECIVDKEDYYNYNNRNDFDELSYWDAVVNEIYYEVHRVAEKYQSLSIEKLEDFISEYGEDFAEKYCDKESVF